MRASKDNALPVEVHISTVWTMLNRSGISLKKKALYATEQLRPEVQQLREQWRAAWFAADASRLVLDGPVNGEVFRAWVEQHLAPTLRPGDIVVMDNLSSHKVEGVKQAIEAAGAGIAYLPPYSPDLNPIEQVFSKLKALLRKHKERTIAALWRRIGKLLDLFSPSECANFIRHCGYTAIQS